MTMLLHTFNRFQWGRLAGWGITIYAIMYFVWSVFGLHGFVAGIAGRSLHLKRWEDVLPYTMGWTLIAIVLDALVSIPVAGWGMYTDWNIWVGYALLLFVPLLAPLS